MTQPIRESSGVTSRNDELPLYPSESWRIVQADLDNSKVFQQGFYWIQVFYDSANISGDPVLAIWDGITVDSSNDPVVNELQFSYSGQILPMKGSSVLSSGDNWRGQTITSNAIDSSDNTKLNKVIVYGGIR